MIQLDQAGIEKALPRVESGLDKYCAIQSAFKDTDVAHDRDFQTSFNGFYRVRRNADWRREFYDILQKEKSARRTFAKVLWALHRATGRIEASFASKIIATVDPSKPVIDSIVLRNVGLRLSKYGPVTRRMGRVVNLHDRLLQMFSDYLRT